MKLLTLNLRHDADRWSERSRLIISELLTEQPDLIAFQEVALSIRQAHLIAGQLNELLPDRHYQVFLESKWGTHAVEGIAIVTRVFTREAQRLELPEGGRIAQRLTIDSGGHVFDIINTHLHHLPLEDESVRLQQIERILDHLRERRANGYRGILMGDLNASPQSKTVDLIHRDFSSAYCEIHGGEPPFTFPTPLITETGPWYRPRTLDYIFFDRDSFLVSEARLAFTTPDPHDHELYPSDHYGIMAVLNPNW